MCGIGCLISRGWVCRNEKCSANLKTTATNVWWQEVLQSIQRRGPDCSGCHRAIAGPPDDRKDTSCPGPASPRVTCDPAMKPVTTPEDPDGCSCPGCGSVLVLCSTLDLHGSVLHLRGGAHATAQPLVNESTGDVLLWNGEIFDGIEVAADENDGAVLLEMLSQRSVAPCTNEQHVASVLSRIQGPWALVYWQADAKQLWFGRDVVGRRSLLWTRHQGTLALSSVGGGPRSGLSGDVVWSEVPAIGVFSLKLDSLINADSLNSAVCDPTLFKWNGNNDERCAEPFLEQDIEWTVHSSLQLECSVGAFNSAVPDADSMCSSVIGAECWQSAQPMECEALAASYHSHEAAATVEQMASATAGSCRCGTEHGRSQQQCLDFRQVLGDAVRRRVSHIPQRLEVQTSGEVTAVSQLGDCFRTASLHCHKAASPAQSDESHCPDSSVARAAGACGVAPGDEGQRGIDDVPQSRVAVLFSGGVDCMAIAALAGQCIPPDEPIDLINVAFEQVPKAKRAGKVVTATSSVADHCCKVPSFDVPDRRTALSGILELDPRRSWRFIEVNVSLEELDHLRKEYVAHLVSPCTSILDDSIGSAIWFAARGRGRLLKPFIAKGETRDLQEICKDYVCPAKVVLVGMGADEQLGGYSRHRQKFLHFGWKGLVEEVSMDINRISHRNLGRDDRVISDHGREARFPFLDEHVLTYLNSLPIQDKVNMQLERGVGEKILLRNVARSLGLTAAAGLPKRAIQFGSRIANSSEKGADKSHRITAASASPS